jgi:hypothetical protein
MYETSRPSRKEGEAICHECDTAFMLAADRWWSKFGGKPVISENSSEVFIPPSLTGQVLQVEDGCNQENSIDAGRRGGNSPHPAKQFQSTGLARRFCFHSNCLSCSDWQDQLSSQWRDQFRGVGKAMKPKSKLTTAVMLQAVFLILSVSVWATADDTQQIGVPQARDVSVKGCFGAVLSPDENHFYTVREGLLTQYQISPFKKIGSIAIDREQFKERPYESRCSIFITSDKLKLIIVYDDRMFLLNASTGQILKRTVLTRKADVAVLNENELVILGRYWDKNEQDTRAGEHDRGLFNLTLWDADTLQSKREIRDLGKRFGFVPIGEFPGISKLRDRIYMTSGLCVVVLNSKTYAPELTLRIRRDAHSSSFNSPAISKNFQKLYVSKVSEVTDHLTGKHTSYDEFKFSSVLVFDQETREFSIENANNLSYRELMSRGELDPVLVHQSQLSRNKGYVMLSGRAHAIFINWLNADSCGSFFALLARYEASV